MRIGNNQLKKCSQQMLSITVAMTVLVVVVQVVYSQRRRPAARPAAKTTTAIDYTKFSHATKKHQASCNTCHKVPSEGWQKGSGYPDIRDYPGHGACVGCHRPQFFKGARPPICAVCHAKTSPRDEVRFPFRNPSSPLQFTAKFPHDKHQDVIALFRGDPTTRTAMVFAHARVRSPADDQTYNNCTICHVPQTSSPKAPVGGWTDGFAPSLATFKASPVNHSSCFNCHWKSQQPVAENCTGCHELTKPYSPSLTPTRISFKFMHDGGGEKKTHVAECTTCHINITKSATLRGLKPDVPITACTECHNKEGLRQDVSKELAAIDKNRTFVCIYCHTSNVGTLDPPASHYLIAERSPIKRKDVK